MYPQCGGGGETEKARWQDQPPSAPSRVMSAWRGGRDEERRIEREHRREDKGNQSQHPPAGYHPGGWWGGDKRRKPTRNGKVAPARGGSASLKTHSREKRTKHPVLCHCVSSQIIRAAPRLGAEEGVGRTTKQNTKHEKPTVRYLSLAARLLKPWPSTEWWGSEGRNKKSQQTSKKGPPRTHR